MGTIYIDGQFKSPAKPVKVLLSQLPSYVDDVLEYATLANFPTTGETGKIYIAINTNLTYRWTGTTYTEISPSIALGETSATAYRGDMGKTAYDHSQTAHAPSTAQKNSDITKAEIEIALGYTPLPQSGGILNDYVEKLVIIGKTNFVNLDEGNTFLKTISADTTFSIVNPKAGAHSFTLIIEMNTLSALTFPTEIKWQDGEAPDMSEANKIYILTFLTIDNGLTWFGMKRGAFKGWDGKFADPEVGRVLHANGLIADANKSSIEELATITSLNPSGKWKGSYFYNNKVITQFPELKYFTGLTNLQYTFYDCSNLTTVVIPEGITGLDSTFYGCSSLTTAPVIPSSVTDLSYTFYKCSNLTTVVIPDGVTNLSNTFSDCSSLTTAPIIPSNVTSLSNTFKGCSNLTTAPIIPSSVTYLYDTFRDCSSIDGIYIINIVTPIYYNNSLSNVKAIYVPDASVDAYKTASEWIEFADIIYPMSDKPQ